MIFVILRIGIKALSKTFPSKTFTWDHWYATSEWVSKKEKRSSAFERKSLTAIEVEIKLLMFIDATLKDLR